MKNLFALAFLLMTIISCQKNDDTNPEPVLPTTGNLTFTIYFEGDPVEGALIGLSKDQVVDEESLFLLIKPTDDDGKVTFELDPGEYFWQIKFPDDPKYLGQNSDQFVDLGLGSLELEAGDNLGSPVFIND